MKKLFGIEEVVNGYVITTTPPGGFTTDEFIEARPQAFAYLKRALEEYCATTLKYDITGVPRYDQLREDESPDDAKCQSTDDNLQSGGK